LISLRDMGVRRLKAEDRMAAALRHLKAAA
jgi:hypothetical protein